MKLACPTCEITANYGLKRHDLGLSDKHSPSLYLATILPNFFGHLVDICGYEVRRDDVLQLLEPEEGHLREYLPLVRHALWKRSGTVNMLQQIGRTLRKMTSYAEIRSVATNRRCSGEDVA